MKSRPENIIDKFLFAESHGSSIFTPQDKLGYREIKLDLDYETVSPAAYIRELSSEIEKQLT